MTKLTDMLKWIHRRKRTIIGGLLIKPLFLFLLEGDTSRDNNYNIYPERKSKGEIICDSTNVSKHNYQNVYLNTTNLKRDYN